MKTDKNLSGMITDLLMNIRADIITQQKYLGMTTTGKTAASIKVDVKGLTGILTGHSSFFQQEHGRKAGRFPNIGKIEKWLKAKGIKPREPKMSFKTLVFLVSRKIAISGTDIFLKLRPPLDIQKSIKHNLGVMAGNISAYYNSEIKNLFK